MTKQTRRLESLRQQLTTIFNQGSFKPGQYRQCHQEWERIKTTKIKGHEFLQWIADDPDTHTDQETELPSLNQLWEYEQIMRQHTDGEVRRLDKQRDRCQQYERLLDSKEGNHKKAHRQVKTRANPVIHQLWHTQEDLSTGAEAPEGSYLYLPDGQKYRAGEPVTVKDKEATIRDTTQYHIQVAETMQELELDPEEEVTVHQRQIIGAPQTVAADIAEYWNQFWQRDNTTTDNSDEAWTQAHDIIAACPQYPEISLPRQTVQEWRQAIQTTKLTSARGTDGISIEELLKTPDEALQEVIDILEDNHDPFPQLTARVVPLAKTDQPGAAQSRPITVLPTLYRIWWRIHTRKCLEALTTAMPEHVTGFMKGTGKGAREASYITQAHIETYRAQGKEACGFSLDLKKCYNLIPRHPLRKAMQRIGVPEHITDKWLYGLNKFTRIWEIHDYCGDPQTSTTGVPEGDPFSIIAMLALADLWVQTLAPLRVRPQAYADNWAWMTEHPAEMARAMEKTQTLTSSLRLQIDWTKCYYWVTTGKIDRECTTALHSQVPPHIQIPRLTAVQDLGCPITFQGGTSSKTIETRFKKTEDKAKRLKQLKASLPVKTQLIATNLLPTALHGAELALIPRPMLAKLRSKLARALFRDDHSSNPAISLYLAMDKSILDPELAYLVQTLLAARTYLQHCTEAEDIPRDSEQGHNEPPQTPRPSRSAGQGHYPTRLASHAHRAHTHRPVPPDRPPDQLQAVDQETGHSGVGRRPVSRPHRPEDTPTRPSPVPYINQTSNEPTLAPGPTHPTPRTRTCLPARNSKECMGNGWHHHMPIL